MRRGRVLLALVAVAALAGVAVGQSSFWCDGGDQQERLYRSLNALRYSDDFKSWTNHTGWAADVHTCEEVAVGTALFSNCTAVSGDGLYDCEGSGVAVSERSALSAYHCREVDVAGETLFNCTLTESQCTTDVVSTGRHLCACQWFGVDCESTEELVALDLSNNNLTILLPDLFFDDIYISINLAKNLVYGELSSHVANLKSLTALDLSKNNFQGQLPDLGALSKLTELNIKSNLFTGYYPTFLTSPPDYWPDMDLVELQFSNNLFWCPAPVWCLSPPTGTGECSTCEDIPSQDGCGEESKYACDSIVSCCYIESWTNDCAELAASAGYTCSTPGFSWLLLTVCIGVGLLIILIGAVIALILTRRGQNFLVMFTRNKKKLVVVDDDEEENDTGLYDIYPDEY